MITPTPIGHGLTFLSDYVSYKKSTGIEMRILPPSDAPKGSSAGSIRLLVRFEGTQGSKTARELLNSGGSVLFKVTIVVLT